MVALDTSPTPGSKIELYVGNDNYELGQTLAAEALKKMGANPNGEVVVGVPNPGVPVLDSRAKGIADLFKEKAPGVKVLGPFQTYSDPSQNFGAWQSLVNAHPGALAYLGVGDADSYDLAKIKKQQNGKYLVAGFDVDAKTLEYVKEGVLFCTLDPEHFLKGYISMQLLIDSNRGKDLPKGWFKTTGLVVDQSNIDEIITRQKSPEDAYDFYEDTDRRRCSTTWTPTCTRWRTRGEPVTDVEAGDGQDRWGVLAARDVVKTYGGVTALSDAAITLRAGEIHALVGENGAGKSTLVKVICGVVAPDAGTVRSTARRSSFGNARDAGAAGISFVAQELSLFPELSVRENLFPLTPQRRLGLINRRALDRQARPVLERLGLDVEMHTPCG